MLRPKGLFRFLSDFQPLHFGNECCPRQPRLCRSAMVASYHPAGGLQDMNNVFALNVVKRGALLPDVLRRLDLGFDGRNLKHPIWREDHCALNEILEFAYVAWPR